MADGTKIEWTDATWNVVTGCSVVSPGCTNCYAMKLAGTRLRHIPSRTGLTRDTKAGPVWTGEVRFNAERLDQPLLWKRPRMIFVCAHGDLFAPGVTDEMLDQIFAVMALAPQHTFQVLTKRPERMREYLSAARAHPVGLAALKQTMLSHSRDPRSTVGAGVKLQGDIAHLAVWPLPNVWLGVSVEDQRRAAERIPVLLDTPAEVRWISAEPLLGPVDMTDWLVEREEHGMLGQQTGFRPPLDWIVVGGESGIAARPCDPQWVRPIRDACARFGVPFLFKQWGSWHSDALRYTECGTGLCPPPKMRIGKKAAGRLLDGVLHDGFPQTQEIPFG